MKATLVNDFIVKRPKIHEYKSTGFLDDTFNAPFESIAIISKRGSGKSTLIFNLIEKFLSSQKQNKMVLIFCKTLLLDPLYKKLMKPIKQAIPTSETKPTIIDVKLQKLIGSSKPKETKIQYEFVPPKHIRGWETLDDLDQVNEALMVNTNTEFLLVFDDVSRELRKNKLLPELIKRLRHSQATIILSSQVITDLPKEIRLNINVYILYGEFPIEKLKDIYNESMPGIPFDQWYSFYKIATKNKYNFFFSDSSANDYRKNLNIKFEV